MTDIGELPRGDRAGSQYQRRQHVLKRLGITSGAGKHRRQARWHRRCAVHRFLRHAKHQPGHSSHTPRLVGRQRHGGGSAQLPGKVRRAPAQDLLALRPITDAAAHRPTALMKTGIRVPGRDQGSKQAGGSLGIHEILGEAPSSCCPTIGTRCGRRSTSAGPTLRGAGASRSGECVPGGLPPDTAPAAGQSRPPSLHSAPDGSGW